MPIGLWVAFTQSRPAAYVVVRDGDGNRLTITQPNNPSFLSPVILFRQTQQIHDRSFPFDTFAVPGVHRVVHILYFTPADLVAFRHDPDAPAPKRPGAILSVSDDRRQADRHHDGALRKRGRRSAGCGWRVTLGTYPVLQLASAPQPFAVLAGLIVFLLAGAWALRARNAVPSSPSYSRNVKRSNFTAGRYERVGVAAGAVLFVRERARSERVDE